MFETEPMAPWPGFSGASINLLVVLDLDGLTKGTAPVRFVHESVLAATLQVAREKLGGIASGPRAYPDPDLKEVLTWEDLLVEGLVARKTVSNAAIQALLDDAVRDTRLRRVKYGILAAFVGVVFVAPDDSDKAAEVEPFKTAITTFFVREWYYVAYAAFWLLACTVLFKGFCRCVCPLGAVMAIGGMVHTRAWIPRREDCGSSC